MKALLGYLADKFDHRVTTAIKHRDTSIAKKLIVKPKAPTIINPKESPKKILDKDGEDFIEYQMKLKKYIDRESKLEDDLQQV